MQRYDDYYRILQVHNLAEPEVIESAYKRLVRKYHPDANGGKMAEEQMVKINQAYEVLSNPEKRYKYDIYWRSSYSKPGYSSSDRVKKNTDNSAETFAAKYVMNEYFKGISQSNFQLSYELITDLDKKRISMNDFIIWQGAVSRIFHLEEYDIKPCKTNEGISISRMREYGFSTAVKFTVDVTEANIVMDMVEKSSFTKMCVLENNKWRVFLGYENLQPIINKFNSLSGLLTAKSVIDELVEKHSRTDALTGLLNKRGILERIEGEILRYNRYGNIFSLVMCRVVIKVSASPDIKLRAEEHAMKTAGEMLVNTLRNLDIVGRYEDNIFLILLPETSGLSANKAVSRLNRELKDIVILYENKLVKLAFNFTSAEYASSIEETFSKLT